MNAIRTTLARLRSDQRGMTTVEYVIVLCLIGALSVGLWNTFGHQIKERLAEASTKIDENTDPNATSPAGE